MQNSFFIKHIQCSASTLARAVERHVFRLGDSDLSLWDAQPARRV